MTALVHDPKAGPLLTGAEWEGDAHRWTGSASDPGAIGAGKTWLLPSNLSGYDVWAALTFYPGGSRIRPSVDNGHTYEASGDMTSGATEPVFDIGLNTPDGDGEWADKGVALSGGNLSKRNDTDTGWGSLSQVIVDPDGVVRGHLWYDDDEGQVILDYLSGTGDTIANIVVASDKVSVHGPANGSVDFDVAGGGHLTTFSLLGASLHGGAADSGTSETGLFYGTTDPTVLAIPAGGTVGIGWIYSQSQRDSAPFSAQLWLCTDIVGGTDLVWTPLIAADLSGLTPASTLAQLLAALGVT